MELGVGLSPSGGLINELSTRKAPSLLCFSHLRWNLVPPAAAAPDDARGAFMARVFLGGTVVGGPGNRIRPPNPARAAAVRRASRGCDSGATLLDRGSLPSAHPAAIAGSARARATDQLASALVHTPRTCCGSRITYPAPQLCMTAWTSWRLSAVPILTSRYSRGICSTRADVVFTGGHSLYESKRQSIRTCILFRAGGHRPFRPGAYGPPEPEDQAKIPHPRLGFYGVVDERIDRAYWPRLPICGQTGRSLSSVPS